MLDTSPASALVSGLGGSRWADVVGLGQVGRGRVAQGGSKLPIAGEVYSRGGRPSTQSLGLSKANPFSLAAHDLKFLG